MKAGIAWQELATLFNSPDHMFSVARAFREDLTVDSYFNLSIWRVHAMTALLVVDLLALPIAKLKLEMQHKHCVNRCHGWRILSVD